ncbi:MAG: alpha-ketoglutaric semialdehyde dehydrogenase [Thermoleophilaceae bacterium]|jgi:aldehyde dehydrogenase (NAD+)|nr:alpha-ketoglutaric semialdehyde dehydrogenase [Thermoleophilaceae bacterium]
MAPGWGWSVRGNLIGGAWIDGPEGVANINPSDVTDVIGDYAHATPHQAADAVDAAVAAWPGWSRTSPAARAEVIDRVGAELIARSEELGTLLAREEGKTLEEAVAEVRRGGQIFRFFAGEAVRNAGDVIESIRPEVDVAVTREPVGVTLIITPWNFPVAIPAWKIAPALAFGNTVVFKPAELVPGSAWELADIIHRAGSPDGAFNLVNGQGSVVGDVLIEASEIAAVSFTGSTQVGRRVALAATKRGARVQLEMGGKNPLVVLDDADLDLAVEIATQGAFFSTGQRCTASSRLVVTEQVYDDFVERLIGRMSQLRTGHALDPATDIGPVVDARQLRQDLDYVHLGRNEGADVVGGERPVQQHDGFYLEPALLVGATNEMRTSREEIFGPVASVIRVSDYDEALAVANDTEFGLTAGIVTRSLRSARHFQRNAEAGMVMVNLPTAGVDFHVPFGGRKASSYGPREQGRYARDFYTIVKTAYVGG